MSAEKVLREAHFQDRMDIRCLDCPMGDYNIELINSPISLEQKRIVKILMKRGCSDLEIYKELGRVYGKHSLLGIETSDGSHYQGRFFFLKQWMNPLFMAPFVVLAAVLFRNRKIIKKGPK